MRSLLLLGLLVGCASNEPMASRVESLGPLTFDVPSDWARQDFVSGGTSTSVWTPTSNERKESIAVIRVERGAMKVKGATLEALVESAQGSLQNARIARIERVSTSRGFSGAKASLSFTPSGKATAYHRVQATLVDGDALVHVFYTAVEPDDTVEPFTLVVDSLRRGEG
ncbi:MAG: hypothetical protein ACKV2T_23285 [Kofleriaceae bacterium]